MMNREHFPAYTHAVGLYLAQKRPELKKYLQAGLVGTLEKNLLQARLLIKNQRFTEALHLLQKLNPQDRIFFAGERFFLLGQAYFHLGEWQKAYTANLEAQTFYANCLDRRGLFLSHYNASVDSQRLGLKDLSIFHLEKAQTLAQEGAEEGLILRAKACEYSRSGQHDLALIAVEQAFDKMAVLPLSDQQNLLAVSPGIYFKAGLWQKSFELLGKLLHKKNNPENARIQFEHALLRSLIKKSALGTAPRLVQKSAEHALMWNILRSMQVGDKTQTQALWKKLCERRPLTFTADLRCLDASEEKGIFMTALKKRLVLPQAVLTNIPARKSKMKLLYQVLAEQNAPLRKEEIIEKVWNTPYHPDLDQRFYKLIERLKKECQLNIINRHAAYQLV